MNQRLTAKDVKEAANANMGRVLSMLRVDARPSGANGTIAICDPMSKDKNPSLVIWTRRPNGLSWTRYGSDAKGDIIDLVAYLNGWWHVEKRERAAMAFRFLTERLRLENVSAAQLAADRRRSDMRQAVERKEADERAARARAWAFQLYINAPLIEGTLADHYLRRRGLDCGALPRYPRILRFLERHEHSDDRGARSVWPCMVAGITNTDGRIVAVHRTWLTHEGTDKAPVQPARKVRPGFAGCVIPLWKGETRLSVREANAAGLRETLVLTEGIEDGLTAAIARPKFRTWAFVSLNNLSNIRLPECIDSVLLHRQSEWTNRQAVAAFEAGRAALEAQGRPVEEVAVFGAGKDLNDMVREGA